MFRPGRRLFGPAALGLPAIAAYTCVMHEDDKYENDLSSKFRSVGWLLIFAIAGLGIALLLKKYDVF